MVERGASQKRSERRQWVKAIILIALLTALQAANRPPALVRLDRAPVLSSALKATEAELDKVVVDGLAALADANLSPPQMVDRLDTIAQRLGAQHPPLHELVVTDGMRRGRVTVIAGSGKFVVTVIAPETSTGHEHAGVVAARIVWTGADPREIERRVKQIQAALRLVGTSDVSVGINLYGRLGRSLGPEALADLARRAAAVAGVTVSQEASDAGWVSLAGRSPRLGTIALPIGAGSAGSGGVRTVNFQVALTADPTTDTTEVVVASPAISSEF